MLMWLIVHTSGGKHLCVFIYCSWGEEGGVSSHLVQISYSNLTILAKFSQNGNQPWETFPANIC